MFHASIGKLILCKSVSDKELKEIAESIPEGSKAAFDIRATIKGILTRGEGYETKPTTSLLSKAVVARLMRNLGATRESAKQALIRAFEESQAAGSVADALVDEDRELLLAIDEVDKDIIAKLPKVRRAGSIKVAATVDLTKSKVEAQ